MKGRPMTLGAVLVLLGLPVALVAIEAVSYYVQNRHNGTLVSSGQTREYLLYVPTSYDPSKPTPLVISLHGGAMWGAAQKETSQWNTVAEKHGFVVVYPSGAGGRGPRSWRASPAMGFERDLRFISDLIDTLVGTYNIDPARIYANGLSNGGGMAFLLSCTMSDRIAAVGMVSAAYFMEWSECRDQRPVPMIAFHGTADPVVPYTGGKTWVYPRPFPNIPGWTARWARRNRCGTEPARTVTAPNVTRLEYADCADDAAVVLYTIQGGGHDWPGGKPVPEYVAGPTSRNVDASSRMWEFFREHPLPSAASRGATQTR